MDDREWVKDWRGRWAEKLAMLDKADEVLEAQGHYRSIRYLTWPSIFQVMAGWATVRSFASAYGLSLNMTRKLKRILAGCHEQDLKLGRILWSNREELLTADVVETVEEILAKLPEIPVGGKQRFEVNGHHGYDDVEEIFMVLTDACYEAWYCPPMENLPFTASITVFRHR